MGIYFVSGNEQMCTECAEKYHFNARAEPSTEFERIKGTSLAGVKHDEGKDTWSVMPWGALREALKVMQFGWHKYGRDNWKRVNNGKERFTEAAMRHLIAAMDGEDNDAESGLPHLAHAACSVLFALYFKNRYEKGD
jgi:hypothetical protein